jgi:D-alanyl-D-alanine carboxypeptidase
MKECSCDTARLLTTKTLERTKGQHMNLRPVAAPGRLIAVTVAAAALVLVAAACGSTGAASNASPSAIPTVAHWTGPTPNSSSMSDADAAAIDKVAGGVLKSLKGSYSPGIWIGVWSPEKGMYIAAYGKAALPDTPATVDDHNRIGSITKTFTATAVLQLVDAGRLSLGDTIADVLPDLAKQYPKVAGITLEQLLGMTSGIPDYEALVVSSVVADPSKVWAPSEIIDLVLQKPLDPPGTPGYSTTNYLILGEMLTKVTGQPVEQVLTDLARQNGLTQTALTAPGDSAMPSPFSHGYIDTTGSLVLKAEGAKVPVGTDVTSWSPSWGGAGGGMYSTIADLGKWGATGLGCADLTPATADRRLQPTDLPGVGGYGLGVIVYPKGWIGHSGEILGWEAELLYNTQTGATYVLMMNTTGSLFYGEKILQSIDPAMDRAVH